MKLKTVIHGSTAKYYKPSMLLLTCRCDWKCCEGAKPNSEICPNTSLQSMPDVEYDPAELYRQYISDRTSCAIVFCGLEPMVQINEILEVVDYFRSHQCMDTIVIYTGYVRAEIPKAIRELSAYPNIIVKFGRHKKDEQSRFDYVLNTYLPSSNQWAEAISGDLTVRLTDDMEKVKALVEAIGENDGYCISQSDRSPESKCPCKDFQQMYHEGECRCGLYKKTCALLTD